MFPTITSVTHKLSGRPRLTNFLGADELEIVLKEYAKDSMGLATVPGLAQLAVSRCLCKGFRDAAAAVTTVYDADIVYEQYGLTTVPVRFRGGMTFGGHADDPVDKWPVFAVIRDKRTSRMFAVSIKRLSTGQGRADWNARWCIIGRRYTMARLAQLLGGHTSDWSRRLPNLHEVAYKYPKINEQLSLRYISLTANPGDGEAVGILRKNQLVAKEWVGNVVGDVTHYDDFFSHRVTKTRWGDRTHWHRNDNGDFTFSRIGYYNDQANSVINYQSTDVLPRKQFSAGTPPLKEDGLARVNTMTLNLADAGESDDRVHVLSRVFGWYCTPRQAEGPGWLISLLPELDRMPNLRDCPVDDMKDMAEDAKEARKAEEARRAQPYHPTNNPTGYRKTNKRGLRERGHRAASAVALERMRQRSDSDVECDDSEESHDTEYVQPMRTNQLMRVKKPKLEVEQHKSILELALGMVLQREAWQAVREAAETKTCLCVAL